MDQYQVWDGDLFLFYCDQYEADEMHEAGFTIVDESK
jgi:hypothetical protein